MPHTTPRFLSPSVRTAPFTRDVRDADDYGARSLPLFEPRKLRRSQGIAEAYELTLTKRARAARVISVGIVPTVQCSHLPTARSVTQLPGVRSHKAPQHWPCYECKPCARPRALTLTDKHINTHAALASRVSHCKIFSVPVTESLSAVQPVIAISELPFPSIDSARTAQISLLRVPYPTQCSGRDPEAIRPLAMHAEAWEAIPGVSEWVLNIVKRGYSLQFARRPPRFRARTETRVNTEAAHLLRTEIAKLWCKGAIERVHPSLTETGFDSRYFLVPKKDGALRPILDLRYLNKALMRRPFKMLTTTQILAQIRPRDWFISLDLKDAYFQIQIIPRHRPFLRFAFDGQVYQYTVLPFGLSLAPRTFTKCMDSALAPLRTQGMRILNYLDDWLILAQSEEELISHRLALSAI
ncbi:hypothetical protein PO909_033786 [Leuciscus waleckii]